MRTGWRQGWCAMVFCIGATGAAASEVMDFVAPGERWAARRPAANCPTICAVDHGYYAEFGAGLAALRRYAATHAPDDSALPYSPALAPIPFHPGEYDGDQDGREDRYGFAHPFVGGFPARRGCEAFRSVSLTPGWSASLATLQVLLYEPEPAPLIDGIAAEVYTRPRTHCALGSFQPRIRRAVLPLFELRRASGHACPQGYAQSTLLRSGRGCRHLGGAVPERNLGAQCPALANGSNPINAVTGNKYQVELDYAGTVHGWLRFERHYNSQSTASGALGPRWRHAYERGLRVTCVSAGGARACSARLERDDGRVLTFVQEGAAWRADATVTERLRGLGTGGYELRTHAGRRETYALYRAGVSESDLYRLVAVSDGSGSGEILDYAGNGRLERVRDTAGRALRFTYDASGRLATLHDPGDARYDYTYDVHGHLAQVLLPEPDDDPASANRGDNPARRYRYEDPADPGALTGLIDEEGVRYASWAYDAAGRAIASEHAGGVGRVAFDYQQGYTAVTDALGVTRSFNLGLAGGVGLITAVSGPPCEACGSAYRAAVAHDARGFPDVATDAAGNLTDLDHDDAGFERMRIDAFGTAEAITTVTTWDDETAQPGAIERRDAAGRAFWQQLNTYRDGRLVERLETDPGLGGGAQRRWRWRYFGQDAADPPAWHGLLRESDGPRDDVDDRTHYAYDAAGNLASVTNPLGQVTRVTRHDAHGRALEIVDPNGVATTLAFHPRGWLLRYATAGAETRFDYDRRGLLARVTLADGSALDYRYDDARRLRAVRDGRGRELRFAHDALGRRSSDQVVDADGTVLAEVRRNYDTLERLTEIVSGGGATVRETRDAAGRLVARSLPYTQPGGAAIGTAFVHDALARVREVRDALGGVLRIDFGPGASPSAVRAANGVETRYDYDAWDRLVARASPDSGGIVYAYDTAGNRVRASSASGAAIGYAYDALDRLVLIDYATGVDTRYVYDEVAGEHGVGRLTRRIDESGTTAYVYDARGNVGEKTLVSDGRQWTTVYRHDAADRLIEIVYPSGRRVRYERDPDGSVARVATAGAGAAEQDVLTAIEHAPFGPPRAWRHGNGVDMRRTYDLDYRLSALEYTGILRRHYAYDAAGNIARVDDPAQPAAAERYRYDALDRLVAADGPWGGLAYAYDANGNRLRASHDTWDARYRYQAGSNRLQSIDARPFAPLRSLLYDSAGRVMRDSAGLRYAYGRNERLATVTQGALARTTRLIHAAGGGIAQERLEVREAGGTRSVTRRFHYDEAGRLLAIEESEDAAASPRLIEFIYLEDTLIAWQHGGALEHVHGDHLGVPLALSAGDGTVLASAAPVPFNGTGAAGPLAAIGYPGQWAMLGVDALMHNGAREYVPGLGRYLSPDPLDLAGGLNGYAYAENNPVALSDPTGTCPWCAAYVAGVAGRALAGAALGAAFNLAEQLYSSTGRWDCVAWAEVGRSAAAGALVAGGIGAYAGRPFWQYFPAGNPAYASRWMTRGAGFKPPYAPGADARGPLSLPPWNPGTAVRGVVPSWWQAVRGPRAVRPGFGQPGGGAEYYRGLGW